MRAVAQPRTFTLFHCALCVSAVFFFFSATLYGQVTEPATRPEIPFEKWIAEGEREEIRWKVKVEKPRLSITQRMLVGLTVELDASEIARTGQKHEYFLMAGMRDAEAGWIPDRGLVGAQVDKAPPKNNALQFRLLALVLPGEYTVGVVLYDRLTNLRNLALLPLRVKPPKNDPLPDSSRGLPRVEFLQAENAYGKPEGHEITGRLWLPAPTRRAVRVEVVVNLTNAVRYDNWAYDRRYNLRLAAGVSLSRQELNAALMLGLMQVFSQLELPNGSLHMTAIDLARRRPVFEQHDVRTLDWPAVRHVRDALNMVSVDVRDIAQRRESATFLRGLLARKVEGPAQMAGSLAGEEPLRVVIFVSSPVTFERGSNLAPLVPSVRGNYVFYHFQFGASLAGGSDDVPILLKRVPARRFAFSSPENLRRAIARLLTDLRGL